MIMEVMKHERYVNPYTDFGFKKLFGTELNKELLISLLNAIFDRSAQQSPGEPKQVVKDLKYLPTEKLEAYGERRAIFDVYCEGESGEKFIVVHRQRPGALPLLPVAHQDEGQRDADAVVGYAFQQRAVGLVAVKLRYLHPCRLPVVGLIVQWLYRNLALHPVQAVGPKLPKPTPSKREQADNLLVLINLT